MSSFHFPRVDCVLRAILHRFHYTCVKVREAQVQLIGEYELYRKMERRGEMRRWTCPARSGIFRFVYCRTMFTRMSGRLARWIDSSWRSKPVDEPLLIHSCSFSYSHRQILLPSLHCRIWRTTQDHADDRHQLHWWIRHFTTNFCAC